MERRELKSIRNRLVIMIGIHISYYVNPEQYFKTTPNSFTQPVRVHEYDIRTKERYVGIS